MKRYAILAVLQERAFSFSARLPTTGPSHWSISLPSHMHTLDNRPSHCFISLLPLLVVVKHTLDNRPVCDDVTVQLAVVTQLKHSIKDLAIKVQPLVFWTDAFRVVNELLQVRNGVAGVHIQFDGLASGDEIHRDGDAVSARCGSAGFVPERSRWRCLTDFKIWTLATFRFS